MITGGPRFLYPYFDANSVLISFYPFPFFSRYNEWIEFNSSTTGFNRIRVRHSNTSGVDGIIIQRIAPNYLNSGTNSGNLLYRPHFFEDPRRNQTIPNSGVGHSSNGTVSIQIYNEQRQLIYNNTNIAWSIHNGTLSPASPQIPFFVVDSTQNLSTIDRFYYVRHTGHDGIEKGFIFYLIGENTESNRGILALARYFDIR